MCKSQILMSIKLMATAGTTERAHRKITIIGKYITHYWIFCQISYYITTWPPIHHEGTGCTLTRTFGDFPVILPTKYFTSRRKLESVQSMGISDRLANVAKVVCGGTVQIAGACILTGLVEHHQNQIAESADRITIIYAF